MPNTADLLEEIATLKAMLIAAEARNLRKDERIERLEKLVAAFKQAAFGRKSEKSDPDQFGLALEDLETAIAAIRAEEDAEDRKPKRPAKPRSANRGALPKHLPRIEEVIEPESLTCACGARHCACTNGAQWLALHCIGEDVSERLDIIPAQFRVIVTRRPNGGHDCHWSEGMPDGLPVLHRWRGAGSGPGAADPRRHADRGDGRPCAGRQIR